MTFQEVRGRLEPLLDEDVFVPVAVDLAGGGRVFIDAPEQVEFLPDALVIRRRSDPKPERYPYSDVTAVTTADALTDDLTGISYAEFDPLIRQLLMRQPFQPFVVELKSGEKIDLDERGGTVRSGRCLLILRDPPGAFTKVTYDQIARIRLKTGAVPA